MPCFSSLVAGAEIGLNDVWVLADFVGHAVADLLAVIQNHDTIGNIHDHAHVVLDKDDGGVIFVVHIQYEAAHVLLFFDDHAGHGLVQQDRTSQRPNSRH